MKLHLLRFNSFEENCYVLHADGTDRCLLADPGCCGPEETNALLALLERERLQPEGIVLTHAHPDHIYGVRTLQDRFGGLPVWMHPADEALFPWVDRFAALFGTPKADTSFTSKPVSDGMVLRLGGLQWEVIETPGHSPGGVCYLERSEGVLLTGDTLFAGAIGRTDLPGGDYDKLIVSIMDRLMGHPFDTRILPGHGPESDIGRERTHNPFLEPWGEVEEDDYSV